MRSSNEFTTQMIPLVLFLHDASKLLYHTEPAINLVKGDRSRYCILLQLDVTLWNLSCSLMPILLVEKVLYDNMNGMNSVSAADTDYTAHLQGAVHNDLKGTLSLNSLLMDLYSLALPSAGVNQWQ